MLGGFCTLVDNIIFPSEQERNIAVDLLVDTYNISMRMLSSLVGRKIRDQANVVLGDYSNCRLDRRMVANLFVELKGAYLFAGSAEPTRKLRKKLLEQLDEDRIRELYELVKHDSRPIKLGSMIGRLSRARWNSGRQWPRKFCSSLGFPVIFSGIKSAEKAPYIEDAEPRYNLPDLVPFQKKLKSKMLKILNYEHDKTRCVISLPTGGGKTRIAVEAFIEWMKVRFAEGGYLVWIAQSEELCEQALSCIKQKWSEQEYVAPLRLYRYYGGRNLPIHTLKGGAVVASIQQLYSRLKSGEDESIKDILANTGAMIIDEAHRAATKMYDILFRKARLFRGKDLFPICGLTATPGRSITVSPDSIKKLVGNFEANLITPNLDRAYSKDPLEYFRKKGYLSRTRHHVVKTEFTYCLTDEELTKYKSRGSEDVLPEAVRNRLADDDDRNKLICRTLMDITPGSPTLVYACSVGHAQLIAAILNTLGRNAGVVSANTSLTLRRSLIERFRNGDLDFLCNYGVLTTGFDAPKTEQIVICRPTRSDVLYEQIVGRGLRGPRFGGTEWCTVIDFSDNLERLGTPQSYVRFKDFWDEED